MKNGVDPTRISVKPGWMKVAACAQAVCRDSNGYAKLTFEVVVDSTGDAILWHKPHITQIHPMAFTRVQMSPGVAAALALLVGSLDEEPG